jgi:transposase-like protein
MIKKQHLDLLRLHKIGNVLSALPKTAHPGAKKALAEIWNAEDRRHALDAVKAFDAAYGAKFPKAVAKITDDAEELLVFFDYPAEHWVHLRTTNPTVIWSLLDAVVHVEHERVRVRYLLGGPGYLPSSMRQIFRRNDACSAGRVARLVA